MGTKIRPPRHWHLIMFSGGVGSWLTAKRVAAKYGTERLRLVFADTQIEDEDLYRFLHEAADDVGGELITLQEGRTPWEVFEDVSYIGNTRIDPCSKHLKRDHIREWLEATHSPDNTTVYLGIDWTEEHRFENAKEYWVPWDVEAPLCDESYGKLIDKDAMLELLEEQGIRQPRLYDMGFPHNNCGGFCIKAGQAHFKHLLETMPERFAYHEGQEKRMREEVLEKDVAILRDRSKKSIRQRHGLDADDDSRDDELPSTMPLPLEMLRERVENGGEIDLTEWGGCGCFVDS